MWVCMHACVYVYVCVCVCVLMCVCVSMCAWLLWVYIVCACVCQSSSCWTLIFCSVEITQQSQQLSNFTVCPINCVLGCTRRAQHCRNCNWEATSPSSSVPISLSWQKKIKAMGATQNQARGWEGSTEGHMGVASATWWANDVGQSYQVHMRLGHWLLVASTPHELWSANPRSWSEGFWRLVVSCLGAAATQLLFLQVFVQIFHQWQGLWW